MKTHADYVAERAFQREVLLHYLATRELPPEGSPKTKIDASRARKVEDPILGWAP